MKTRTSSTRTSILKSSTTMPVRLRAKLWIWLLANFNVSFCAPMLAIWPVKLPVTAHRPQISANISGSLLCTHSVAQTDDKHKQLVEFSYIDEFQPKVDRETFIAPNATLAGNVEVCCETGSRLESLIALSSVYILQRRSWPGIRLDLA